MIYQLWGVKMERIQKCKSSVQLKQKLWNNLSTLKHHNNFLTHLVLLQNWPRELLSSFGIHLHCVVLLLLQKYIPLKQLTHIFLNLATIIIMLYIYIWKLLFVDLDIAYIKLMIDLDIAYIILMINLDITYIILMINKKQHTTI